MREEWKEEISRGRKKGGKDGRKDPCTQSGGGRNP